MKKSLMLGLVVLLVLGLALPAAFALTDSQKTELQSLYREQHELRLRILEKQAEAGLVDTDEAGTIRERMAERWEQKQQRMDEGDYSFGFGRKKMMNRGEGFSRMRGGCGNCPVETGQEL